MCGEGFARSEEEATKSEQHRPMRRKGLKAGDQAISTQNFS
jgi:hypothetical protein